MNYKIPSLPIKISLETPNVLKKLETAHRALAELNEIAASIPDQNDLLSMLLQEGGNESSENIISTWTNVISTYSAENVVSTWPKMENIISTYPGSENIVSTYPGMENIVSTYNGADQNKLPLKKFANSHAKEKNNYALALGHGYNRVKQTGRLTNADILEMQSMIVENKRGFRKSPGTELKKENTRQTIYIPPQESEQIQSLMDNLESFINGDVLCNYDPLIKMAIIHHQFLSIHPFYDGNGRASRMVSVLYLVKEQLLSAPILYLSRAINQNKGAYYHHLQAVRENQAWEEWVLYLLEAIIQASTQAIGLIETQGAKNQTLYAAI